MLLPSGLQSQPRVCPLSLLGRLAWLLSCSCRHWPGPDPGQAAPHLSLPGKKLPFANGATTRGCLELPEEPRGQRGGHMHGTSDSFLLTRVEKKERARLKTVKFHARTGMIESNRVSADLGLSGAPGAGN